MSELKQFKLPDVGEGLTEADIVSWKVRPGDTVKVNDVLVEIETAKSLVELPSPYAGVVSELLADEGSTVEVGAPIITVDVGPQSSTVDVGPQSSTVDVGPQSSTVDVGPQSSTVDVGPQSSTVDVGAGARSPELAGGGGGVAATQAARPDAGEDEVATPGEHEAVEPGLIGGPAPGGRTSVLVGYGPRTTVSKRRPRKARTGDSASGTTPAAASAATAQQAVQTSMMRLRTPLTEPAHEDTEHAAPAHTVDTGPRSGRARVLAKPPVRRLAKDLGVDLSDATPSGPDGTVTRADVEALVSGGGADRREQPGAATYARSSGEQGGESRVPVKGVRKMTAQAVVASAFTAPHVTEWVTVDVTRTMDLVERLRTDPEFADVKVSPLLVVAKALVLAVRRHPGVNATWDEQAQEIVLKHYVNLGIAVASPRGLLVPSIKGAERMTLRELANALNDVTAICREGRAAPEHLAGGTITITNVGVFGVDGGTPIINPGESAILAVGAIRDMPWVHEGQLAIRKVAQLALSFDHRLIDGELGSRFLTDIARVLEDPATALLW